MSHIVSPTDDGGDEECQVARKADKSAYAHHQTRWTLKAGTRFNYPELISVYVISAEPRNLECEVTQKGAQYGFWIKAEEDGCFRGASELASDASMACLRIIMYSALLFAWPGELPCARHALCGRSSIFADPLSLTPSRLLYLHSHRTIVIHQSSCCNPLSHQALVLNLQSHSSLHPIPSTLYRVLLPK